MPERLERSAGSRLLRRAAAWEEEYQLGRKSQDELRDTNSKLAQENTRLAAAAPRRRKTG